jgi:phage N-6-adenine-methyltransferase
MARRHQKRRMYRQSPILARRSSTCLPTNERTSTRGRTYTMLGQRSGAAFNRGASKQDYSTPRDFLAAVEKRFGKIVCDLAATAENRVCDQFLGPGSPYAADSLSCNWHKYRGLYWLNPPFANIEPWAKKCCEEMNRGARILFLVPASVGSRWFEKYVLYMSDVYFLAPRLSFDGKHPFPKDCMLCHYEPLKNHFPLRADFWRWK